MLKKDKELRRNVIEFLCTEDRIPHDHLLRQIDNAVDFSRLYDIIDTQSLYSSKTGRPSVDPVVLFKIVLIQHLYGISSLRRTMQEIDMNIAYRWFLGYSLSDPLPHFSTVSYNFKNRYNEETIERVFRWILYEADAAGYLSPEAVYIDGTHIKANANIKKKVKKAVPQAALRYKDELLEEINTNRAAHGKKPLKNNDDDDNEAPPATKTITQSTSDPDCGMFVKGEHERQFAYETHTACDENGFVLEAEVTAGNVHDSVAFDDVYDKLIEHYPEVHAIAADSAYKTPHICKKVFDDGRVLSSAYKRPMTRKGGHAWWKYVYDEHNDWVICPEYKTLYYATTNRDGYREYKALAYQCASCPSKNLCTDGKAKVVTRHVWQDYIELAEDVRYTPEYKALYARRKETIERVFADAKEKHAMRYTRYRGLAQVSKWVKLKFAAMNLKKLAMWKCKLLSFFAFLRPPYKKASTILLGRCLFSTG